MDMELLQSLETGNISTWMVLGVLITFSIIEIGFGFLKQSQRSKDDWTLEIISFITLSLLVKPLALGVTLFLCAALIPDTGQALSWIPFGWACLMYLLTDDLIQYGYHRGAHANPFFWKLHRAHHQAEEMGFFVSYRNAALYYLLMPNVWWLGLVVFWGGAGPAALGLIIKQSIIISSHSRVTWDAPFYRHKLLRPLIRLLERIFITPAFHHAHHGQSKADGVSNPNGNFGNLFSIWDQLFGSAHFPRSFPDAYGLPQATHDRWHAAYLYPLVASSDPKSELSRGFKKHNTTSSKPSRQQVEAGKTYLWCSCGLSQNQPFCDGSHHGTGHQPVAYVAQKDANLSFCHCKHTGTPPFCDNSHLTAT